MKTRTERVHDALLECADGSDDMLVAIAGQIRQGLPRGFAVVACTATAALPIPPSDRREVALAVPRRQADYVGGRWCAHRALALSGEVPCTLPVGALGAPVWPEGTLGSITHDAAWCMAVAGRSASLQGIGIDLCAASRRAALRELGPLVLTAGERALAPSSDGRAAYLQLLFCIKEAVVKSISARAGRFLDLHDIEVQLDGARFGARVECLAAHVEGWHGSIEGHAFALALARR